MHRFFLVHNQEVDLSILTEAKWHTELNTVYTFTFTANIKNDNKFKPNVSPLSTYCQTTNERLNKLHNSRGKKIHMDK